LNGRALAPFVALAGPSEVAAQVRWALKGLADLGPWAVYTYGLVLVGVFVWALVTRFREAEALMHRRPVFSAALMCDLRVAQSRSTKTRSVSVAVTGRP